MYLFRFQGIIRSIPHDSTSAKDIFRFQGFYTYFGIGYLMELLKNVLRYQTQLLKNPKLLYSSLINEKNIRFGLFFGGFVGVYEVRRVCLEQEEKTESFYFKCLFLVVGLLFTKKIQEKRKQTQSDCWIPGWYLLLFQTKFSFRYYGFYYNCASTNVLR